MTSLVQVKILDEWKDALPAGLYDLISNKIISNISPFRRFNYSCLLCNKYLTIQQHVTIFVWT